MGIARIWEDVETDFEVCGLKDGRWRAFKKNVNYEAFLVKRK